MYANYWLEHKLTDQLKIQNVDFSLTFIIIAMHINQPVSKVLISSLDWEVRGRVES